MTIFKRNLSYICVDILRVHKAIKNILMKYKTTDTDTHTNNALNEAAVAYSTADDTHILTIIQRIRKGINFSIFSAIAQKIPFTMNEWSSFLHLSERTMQRYQKEKKAFDPIYSEKIIEITMLYNYGIEVFGNKENFDKWLQTQNVALGGNTPKDFLDSTFGIQLIKDELTRIEYGVLA